MPVVIIIAILIVLLLMFLGMPVSFSFLFASMAYFFIAGESLSTIAPTTFFSLQNSSLLALPLFIIAGNLMEASGIATKLVDFSESLLKKVKGGFGSIIPLASMFFGALCGSGTATVATLSIILLPKLTKRGWDKRYICALLAAAGPLGYMIPPNINAILFAYISDSSVAALFLATVFPGILWGILYMIINRIIYKKYNPEVMESFLKEIKVKTLRNQDIPLSQRQNFYTNLRGVMPAFIMPIIIMGGIYGGIFTATEAGAVSCAYALIVGFFIYKQLNFQNSYESFKKAALLIGSFMIVFPLVMVFSRILVINGIPQAIAIGMTSLTNNRNLILLIMDIIYFIAGVFLNANILVVVLTPLMIPIAYAIDLNIIQLGVMLMVAIGIGTLTPPMALNLYVASDISGVGIHEMVKPLIPFLFLGAIPILLLVTYFPAFSLWLPKVVMGINY